MADIISEYKKWKTQGENLRTEAKQAMESRFRELLTEAMSIAEEYRADFGAPLKPPPAVTAFRYKTSGKPKAKKPAKQAGSHSPEIAHPESDGKKPNPKIAGLQKQLATARNKLDHAKRAGTPTRAIEDRIYEIEDALRLAGQSA